MDWGGKLIETVTGGLPSAAAALCPDHLKKKWLERLSDHNPFRTISANHDLVRATRLAWIEAAQDILKQARKQAETDPWRRQASDIKAFNTTISDILLDTRDHALDRRKDPGPSAIDEHVRDVIAGMPELVSPGEHKDIGTSVTAGFTITLAALSGWQEQEIPSLYKQIAVAGLATHGGGPARPFGELVFAAFAEIIKDPKKYPQAREAFYIAMDKLGRNIGETTLAAVKGLDEKLDRLIVSLDGLEVLRNGAIRYLELLPRIAEDTAATRARVEVANQKLDELLHRIAQTEGVPLDALRTILADMGETAIGLDAGQVEERLKAKASEFKTLTDRLNRLSNDDPEVSRLRQAAAKALAAGKFAQADAHLAAAELRDLNSLEDLEAFATRKRLSAAESRAERAVAARLRMNPAGYREAASHFGEAARIAQSADQRVSREYKRKEGRALIDLGETFGLNSALLEAIQLFRAQLASVEPNTETVDWAVTQDDLGYALYRLGQRENGTARLEEAVAAHRWALQALSREGGPLGWAGAANNLGNALSALGERERGTARLEEAVSTYRAALEERTRERVPLEWAATQKNLGMALRALGERQSVIPQLERAVVAYRASLEVYTREQTPLQWARTQANIADALRTIGQHEGDTARLKESIAACRSALEELTRERVPLDWSEAKNILGNALLRLGERENGTRWLEEAIAAYYAALVERTRERMPFKWAITQNNLGLALQTLGERESGTVRLEAAIIAYSAALEIINYESLPLYWAMTTGNMGVALRIIAERRKDLTLAERALQYLAKSCETYATFHSSDKKYYAEQVKLARALVETMSSGR